MTRLFVSISNDEVQSVKRAGYAGEILEHTQTRLLLRSEPLSGFYVGCEYSIGDIHPLSLRDDIPYVYRVEHLETLHRAPGASWVCGWFTCDTGKVKISEIGVRHEALIVADSVDDFNATVQALRNGELKPVGSDKTVVEKLLEEVDELKNHNSVLQKREYEWMLQIHKLEQFITQVTLYLSGKGPFPEHKGDTLLDELSSTASRLKDKTFWQIVWSSVSKKLRKLFSCIDRQLK